MEENAPLYSDIPCDDDFGDFNDDDDNEVDRSDQIFNFVVVPSFVSLLSGSSNNLLYFVKVTEKRAASENHPDPYGHFISAGEKFLKGFDLNLDQEILAKKKKKKKKSLSTEIVFSPDEVFNI